MAGLQNQTSDKKKKKKRTLIIVRTCIFTSARGCQGRNKLDAIIFPPCPLTTHKFLTLVFFNLERNKERITWMRDKQKFNL